MPKLLHLLSVCCHYTINSDYVLDLLHSIAEIILIYIKIKYPCSLLIQTSAGCDQQIPSALTLRLCSCCTIYFNYSFIFKKIIIIIKYSNKASITAHILAQMESYHSNLFLLKFRLHVQMDYFSPKIKKIKKKKEEEDEKLVAI